MTDAAFPLFGDEEHAGKAEVDETFAAAQRVRLDAHSWVEHVPGWLTGRETLRGAARGGRMGAAPGCTARR